MIPLLYDVYDAHQFVISERIRVHHVMLHLVGTRLLGVHSDAIEEFQQRHLFAFVRFGFAPLASHMTRRQFLQPQLLCNLGCRVLHQRRTDVDLLGLWLRRLLRLLLRWLFAKRNDPTKRAIWILVRRRRSDVFRVHRHRLIVVAQFTHLLLVDLRHLVGRDAEPPRGSPLFTIIVILLY